MPADDILDGGEGGAPTGGQSGHQHPSGNPSQASNPDPALVTKAINEALAPLGKELQGFAGAIKEQVERALGGRAPSHEQPPNGGGDAVQRYLTDPEAEVRKTVTSVVREILGPVVATGIQNDYDSITTSLRTRTDAQWGEGAFDSLVGPEVERVLAEADKTNPAARGNRTILTNIVRGVIGHEDILPKLQEHKTKADSKREADMNENSGGILGPGRRAPKPGTLSPEDIKFLADYEERTGQTIDRKAAESMLTIYAKDGRWDAQNVNSKNKLPVKGRPLPRRAQA